LPFYLSYERGQWFSDATVQGGQKLEWRERRKWWFGVDRELEVV
jgi:hypothetical protein